MKRAKQVSQSFVWHLVALASRVYLGVFIGLAMWAVIPFAIHWQSTIVVSGSMEPGLSVGDVVVAQTYTSDQVQNGAIKVGDVTLADNPAKPGSLITHRVTEILTNGSFITKGDANRTADSTPVPRQNVLGVERLLIPYIGIPIDSLRKGDPVPAVIFGIITLIAQMIVMKHRRQLRASETPDESESTEPAKNDDGKQNKNRSKALPALGAGLVAIVAIGSFMPTAETKFSRASFSFAAPNSASTFAASIDWTPPLVSMPQPASPFKGTVNIAADVTDANSGVKDATIQYLPSNGSAWVSLCTDTTAPYSCSWTTTQVTDGGYDLRVIGTDKSGYSAISNSVHVTVANSMLVVLDNPGDYARGTVPLTTTLYNIGTVTYSVRVEYSVSGANSWKSICSGLASPYNCSWATTGFANGDYDLRSVAVSGGTTFTSQVITGITADNVAPTVSMVDPTTPISGSWTFSANASDADSGIATVILQYAPNGSSTYTNLCSFTATPYSCRVDSLTIPNGTYTFRAVADDYAGNRTISALITNRVVDNTISSVSMEDPGAYLTGTVTLKAVANSTAGVGSVLIQRAPAGSSSWADICTSTVAPYTCQWNSATVSNGSYDFRAVLTDTKGATTVSSVMGARQVDNLVLRGFDFQTASGTVGTLGKADQGDAMIFTYNSLVNLNSVSSGWNGSSLPVTVRLRDGALTGVGSGTDIVDVQRTGGSVNLGTVDLRQDYVKNQKTATFNATMIATTITVNGVQATKVTVTIGTVATGSTSLRITKAAAGMIWYPSALVTDVYGNVSSTAPVNESGSLDKDY